MHLQIQFLVRTFFLADCCLLTASSQRPFFSAHLGVMGKRERFGLVSHPLCIRHKSIQLEPLLMTSFNLNNPLKGPVFNYGHTRSEGFNMCIWEDVSQSITRVFSVLLALLFILPILGTHRYILFISTYFFFTLAK